MTCVLVKLCLPSCLVLAGGAAEEFVSGLPESWIISFSSPISFITAAERCQCTSQKEGKAGRM